MEPLPDLAALSDEELKSLIDDLQHEEQEVSYRRRLLHGKIDILRAELVSRLQKQEGAGRARSAKSTSTSSLRSWRQGRAARGLVSHVYCPECGFQNPEAANFCSKCGALARARAGPEPTRRSRSRRRSSTTSRRSKTSDGGRLARRALRRRPCRRAFRPERGPNDHRPLAGLRHLPRRRHRLSQARRARARRRLVHDRGSGSLNGTFVNKRRIDSAPLTDGDEVQIGKYRLTFLEQ